MEIGIPGEWMFPVSLLAVICGVPLVGLGVLVVLAWRQAWPFRGE